MLRATGTARAAAALFVISSVHNCVENRREDPAVKRTGVGDHLRAPTQGALGWKFTNYTGTTWTITMTAPAQTMFPLVYLSPRTIVNPYKTYRLTEALMPDSRMAAPAYPASPLFAIALLRPKADPTKSRSAQST